MNIDRLTEMLEENRDLLNEMTQAEGSCSDGATLPKLLFELVEQAAKSEQTEDDKSRSATPTPAPAPSPGQDEVMVTASGEDNTDCVKPEPSARKLHRRRSGGAGADGAAASLKSHEPEIMGKVATAQEIIGNLPKVWKVLMELLSHHKIERVQFEELPPAADDAHSNVVAPTTVGAVGGAAGGTGAAAKAPELSVSKTYIKLKVSLPCGWGNSQLGDDTVAQVLRTIGLVSCRIRFADEVQQPFSLPPLSQLIENVPRLCVCLRLLQSFALFT